MPGREDGPALVAIPDGTPLGLYIERVLAIYEWGCEMYRATGESDPSNEHLSGVMALAKFLSAVAVVEPQWVAESLITMMSRDPIEDEQDYIEQAAHRITEGINWEEMP